MLHRQDNAELPKQQAACVTSEEIMAPIFSKKV